MKMNISDDTKNSLIRTLMNTFSCFAMLLYWELMLYFQLYASLKGFSFWNVLLMIPLSFLLVSLTGWFDKHCKIDYLLRILINAVLALFYIAEFLYCKTFGSLFSFSMIGAGTDAVTNFWWSLKSTVSDNLLSIFLFLLPVLLQICRFFTKDIKTTRESVKKHVVLIALAVLTWFMTVTALPIGGTEDYTAYAAYHSKYVDTDTASRKLGTLPNFLVEMRCSLFGSSGHYDEFKTPEEEQQPVEEKEVIQYNEYDDMDFSVLSKDTDDENIKNLSGYLSSQSPTAKNEYTGLFEGYNLIYICAESFSRMAVDESVTPVLYKMMNNGIVLNNYYNSFKNVTTNGEYAFLTGLWPDVAREETNKGRLTGTMGQSIEKDMSTALGNMFYLSENVEPRAYHNFLGYYYGRNETLPNMGFTCKFMNEGMTFTTSWPASDLEMMEQSVDDYINDDRFCTYYMTFSGHGNYTTDNVMVYKNIDTVSELTDKELSWNSLGYLSANYELEKAMEYLLQRLEDAGRLDSTVIVLTGDHYPYYLSDEGYYELTGEEFDENFEGYKSTCIIYNAGLEKNIEVDTPCCNVDILPTIYNLFNISYDSRLYAGTDVFGNGFHLAQLYNKSFVTEYVKYNSATGEAEWVKDTYQTEEYNKRYLERAINTAKNRYAMSIEVEESDFFGKLFDHYDIKVLMAGRSVDRDANGIRQTELSAE